jgi:hypothetical protein
MADQACLGCGATSAGVYVCHFCGVPVHPLTDADSQRKALDELHGRLSAKDPPPDLLKNAFLPDDPRVLIEAGLRLLPVLEDAVAQSAAAGRMRAVIIKLRLLGDNPSLAKAAKEFQAALDSYRRSDRQMGYIVGLVLLVIAAIVIAKCVV